MSRLTNFLMLTAVVLSGWGAHASESGLYHKFTVGMTCEGHRIFKNKDGMKEFTESYLSLLMNSEASDPCLMAHTLNLSSFVRAMIYDNDKANYILFQNVVNERYQQARSFEKAQAMLCRYDRESLEETPYCESDRLMQINQVAFRVWWDFFKKDLLRQIAFEEGATLGSFFTASFVIGALVNSDVRSQAFRFVKSLGKSLFKIFRATGKVTRSVGSAARGGAVMGRSASVGRTATIGGGGGAGVTSGQLNEEDELEFIRSTEDFANPLEFLVVDEPTWSEWGLSFLPCLTGQEAYSRKTVGYRKSGCKNAQDITVALVGGILPAYLIQNGIYQWVVHGALLKTGALSVLKRSSRKAASRAIKIAKNPYTLIVGIIAGGFTVGMGINHAYKTISWNQLVNGMTQKIAELKRQLRSKDRDLNAIETYFAAQDLVSYSEALALVKMAPLGDEMERFSAKAHSRAVCAPIQSLALGHENEDQIYETGFKVFLRGLQSEVDAYYERASTDKGEFESEKAQMMTEGCQVLQDVGLFISQEIKDQAYFGLKSGIYEMMGYFGAYRSAFHTKERLNGNVRSLFYGSFERAKTIKEFAAAFDSDPMAVPHDLWRKYLVARHYFERIETAVEAGGHKLSCDYKRYVNMFRDAEYMQYVPCALGEDYTAGLKQCI